MAVGELNQLILHLRSVLDNPGACGLSDGDLLRRYYPGTEDSQNPGEAGASAPVFCFAPRIGGLPPPARQAFDRWRVAPGAMLSRSFHGLIGQPGSVGCESMLAPSTFFPIRQTCFLFAWSLAEEPPSAGTHSFAVDVAFADPTGRGRAAKEGHPALAGVARLDNPLSRGRCVPDGRTGPRRLQ